jgi:hypothetical protein
MDQTHQSASITHNDFPFLPLKPPKTITFSSLTSNSKKRTIGEFRLFGSLSAGRSQQNMPLIDFVVEIRTVTHQPAMP